MKKIINILIFIIFYSNVFSFSASMFALSFKNDLSTEDEYAVYINPSFLNFSKKNLIGITNDFEGRYTGNISLRFSGEQNLTNFAISSIFLNLSEEFRLTSAIRLLKILNFGFELITYKINNKTGFGKNFGISIISPKTVTSISIFNLNNTIISEDGNSIHNIEMLARDLRYYIEYFYLPQYRYYILNSSGMEFNQNLNFTSSFYLTANFIFGVNYLKKIESIEKLTLETADITYIVKWQLPDKSVINTSYNKKFYGFGISFPLKFLSLHYGFNKFNNDIKVSTHRITISYLI